MAKKTKKAGTKKPSKKKPAARTGKTAVTVRKTAAAVGGAVGKAVKTFTENLGALHVDSSLAADRLTELGTLLEDVAAAKLKADEKATDAKTAKATCDSKVNLLLEKLRGFTHPKALPLFDAAQAEGDRQTMLDAVNDDTPF